MEDRVIADSYDKSPDYEGQKARPEKNDLEQRLADYIDYFELAEEMSTEADRLCERDRDYYDGIQYTAKELEEYRSRKQPALVFNHVKRKINFLIGYEDEQRGDPKAFPRNVEADDDAAHAATDALRFVADKAKFPDKDGAAFENLVIDGLGCLELGYNAKTKNVDVKHWPWDRVFFDPFSTRPDLSDALYIGGVLWIDKSRARALYPGKEALIDKVVEEEENDRVTLGDKYKDKPREKCWADVSRTRKRVRIVQIYCRHGETWYWAHYTKTGFLHEPQPVMYKDDEGNSYCPMIAQSCYVNRNNERYGEARDLIDLQDEINKRRSKILHLTSVRQLSVPTGTVDDIEKIRKEFAKPDGVIEWDPAAGDHKVEVLDTSDMVEASARLLDHAQKEMEIQGPNAALQGKQGQDASGRAIIASQQGGLLEHRRTFKRQKSLRLRAYTIMWWMIKQFWNEEKWIRVTDDEKNIRFVGFNRKTTVRQLAIEDAQQIEDINERSQIIQGLTNAPEPELDQETMINDISTMHMDIELDESVDSVVIQQEQFEEVVKLAQAGVPFAPEDLIELSQLKNKDKVLERMKQRAEQAAQAAAAGPGGAEGPAGPDPRVADATAAQAASKAAQQDIKTQREQVGLMKDMQPDPKPQPGKPGGK
jgi:hypothetical protein